MGGFSVFATVKTKISTTFLMVYLEIQVSEMKKLVEEEKVTYIGPSEASPNTIQRAHAVHLISAVQIEWSLWKRYVEDAIIPLCR